MSKYFTGLPLYLNTYVNIHGGAVELYPNVNELGTDSILTQDNDFIFKKNYLPVNISNIGKEQSVLTLGYPAIWEKNVQLEKKPITSYTNYTLRKSK